jgi:hypothetical protein
VREQSKANLDVSKAGANGEIGAFARPVHGADAVPRPKIAELGNLDVINRSQFTINITGIHCTIDVCKKKERKKRKKLTLLLEADQR